VTISSFRSLNENLKIQTYMGIYIIISSLIGLLIKIGVLLHKTINSKSAAVYGVRILRE